MFGVLKGSSDNDNEKQEYPVGFRKDALGALGDTWRRTRGDALGDTHKNIER